MQNETKLDPTNCKLIALLQENGRQSATALGKALGLSRTAVQDRMMRLEDQGIIQGYTVRIANLDTKQFQALIHATITERPCAPTLLWLRGLPGVEQVLSVSGKSDVVVQVALGNASELSRFVDQISSNECIGTVTSQVILDVL